MLICPFIIGRKIKAKSLGQHELEISKRICIIGTNSNTLVMGSWSGAHSFTSLKVDMLLGSILIEYFLEEVRAPSLRS